MVPKVDTFEHDIASEIKRKEASLAEISSASNNVGNNDVVELPKKTPLFFIYAIGLIVLSSVCLGVIFYLLFTNQERVTTPPQPQLLKTTVSEASLQKISPTLSANIGMFVKSVDKKQEGVIIYITEYSPVFAYMTRNEESYIAELSQFIFSTSSPVISGQKNTAPALSTTTPPTPSTTTVQATGTSKTSTTTKNTVATSSKITPQKRTATTTLISTSSLPVEKEEYARQPEETLPYRDVTLSNQNMRIWTVGNKTIVYAFIGTKAVAIASTPDAILSLRSAILR